MEELKSKLNLYYEWGNAAKRQRNYLRIFFSLLGFDSREDEGDNLVTMSL